MPDAAKPLALFIAGPAGCGKTTLAKAWVRDAILHGQPWSLIDKDVVGGLHGPRMLQLLGSDPHDRDSPMYKKEVRALDYGAALNLAADQLALGGSVALPGPWTRELVDGSIFDAQRLGLPKDVHILVVWLSLPEAERKRRIEKRQHAQDAWKVQNWEAYSHGAAAQPPAFAKPPLMLDACQDARWLLRRLRDAVSRAAAG